MYRIYKMEARYPIAITIVYCQVFRSSKMMDFNENFIGMPSSWSSSNVVFQHTPPSNLPSVWRIVVVLTLRIDILVVDHRAAQEFLLNEWSTSHKEREQCPPNSSDRQDKYVIGPICLISSPTELSDVVSNTMYIMYTQSQTDRSSVLWNDSPNRTECPMKFHKVSRTLREAEKQYSAVTCPNSLDTQSVMSVWGARSVGGAMLRFTKLHTPALLVLTDTYFSSWDVGQMQGHSVLSYTANEVIFTGGKFRDWITKMLHVL